MKWDNQFNKMNRKRILYLLITLMIISGCQNVYSPSCSSLEPIPIFHQQGKENMKDIYMKIKQQTFQVHLYDNQASKQLIDMLPMTVTMNDLNDNEKYIYLNTHFSTQVESIEMIKSGDLMLFGSNCLVLFYNSFETSYKYTRIGYIENKDQLIDVLKEKIVDITFEVQKEEENEIH